MKEGRKPEYPEKTPNNELQKMPYTKAGKFNIQFDDNGNGGEKGSSIFGTISSP